MIKLEQADVASGQRMACLNPSCLESTNRIFNYPEHSNIDCRKWQVDLSKEDQTLSPFKELESITVNLSSQPITAFKQLCRLRESKWEAMLKKQENKLRKEICKALEQSFLELHNSISTVLKASEFYSKGMGLIKHTEFTSKCSQLLEQWINETPHSLNFSTNQKLFDRLRIDECTNAVIKAIRHLKSAYVEQKPEVDHICSVAEQRVFYEFAFQPVENSYGKLQILASAFNLQPSLFTIKENTMQLACFQCRELHITNVNHLKKNQAKKNLPHQVIQHIYKHHYQETCFLYNRRIKKSHVRELTIPDLLSSTSAAQCVHLIDRESGPAFEYGFEAAKRGEYAVEIVSKKGLPGVKEAYLLVKQSERIDLFISQLAEALKSRGKKIKIHSKRTTFAEGSWEGKSERGADFKENGCPK